jgi:ribosomal-protein-serine acetyltransferase
MFTYQIDDELLLRLPEERFAEESTALIRENLAHLGEWLPWATEDYSTEQTLEFIRRNVKNFAENQGFSAQIVFRGRVAGNVGFNRMDWANRQTEIGYWLGASFQGRGLMTKACRAFVSYAFEELKLNRVEISCAAANARSRAIPERLGFTQEGVLRQAGIARGHFHDLIVYSMLAGEWNEGAVSSQ